MYSNRDKNIIGLSKIHYIMFFINVLIEKLVTKRGGTKH